MLNEPYGNTDSRDTFVLYRGYNPEFYKAVIARRKAEAEARIQREKEARVEEARQHAEKMRAARQAFWQNMLREQEEACRKHVEQTRAEREKEAIEKAATLFPITAKAIITRVALEHGYSYKEIIGYSRIKEVMAARHAAMRAVADERPDMSVLAIGRAFHRDHSTVLSSLRKTRQPGVSR